MANKQTTRSVTAIGSVGSSVRTIEPKTVAAVVLVAVMGLLWARVLLRSGPEAAMADPLLTEAESVGQDNPASDIQIQPVVLAEIPGRHDVIAADYFRADRCSAWNHKEEPVAVAVKVVDDQSRILELKKAIALEAIIKDAQGKAEKACINGTLVTVGSVIQVVVKNEMQTIRIVTVEPGRVQLNWQDRSIDIEMPDQKIN